MLQLVARHYGRISLLCSLDIQWLIPCMLACGCCGFRHKGREAKWYCHVSSAPGIVELGVVPEMALTETKWHCCNCKHSVTRKKKKTASIQMYHYDVMEVRCYSLKQRETNSG
jgi:hypothetical protein